MPRNASNYARPGGRRSSREAGTICAAQSLTSEINRDDTPMGPRLPAQGGEMGGGKRKERAMSEISNVDYSTKIPNNVGLTEDRAVLKALESWHPGFIDWWKDMGPDGFQEALVYLRTAVSVDPKGWAKFDYVQDAGIPLGHAAGAGGRGPQDSVRPASRRAGLAGGAGRIPRHAAPPDRDPGRHRAGLGRAAAPSRQDRALALRHAQRVPGQCRGGPPPVGDGLSAAEIFRPRRPRGGRGAAAAPLRRRRQAAHARRLQRGDAGLAVVLHVHLLHRPRRQDAARKPRAVGLRSAVAHLPLHAHRRSAPHVRRRDRHRAHAAAHLRGDEGGRHRGRQRHREGARARRHRPADDAEEAQPALHAVARPVRLGGLDQRRQRLQCRHQGPLPGDQDRGRPSSWRARPIRCSSWSTARSSASTSRR